MSTAPVGPTDTLLQPFPVRHPFSTCRFLCQTYWTCWSDPQQRYTWRQRSDVVRATEEPLSVILPFARTALDLTVVAEPAWSTAVPDWRGIPCDIGRTEIWLPVEGGLPMRPFSLLTLLPQRDLPDLPPFIILGVQFLVEYDAAVTLECAHGQQAGRLRIP